MVAQTAVPHILIADTEQTNCRVFEAKLSRHGPFRVVGVTSVTDAVQALVQTPFDLLLWDLRLRDSAAALPRLRAMSPNAALLLMTTDDRPQFDPDLALLDVADTLVKPFNLETMVEKVNLALAASPVSHAYARLDLVHIGQQLAIQTERGSCLTRVLDYRQDSILVVASPRVQAPEEMAVGQRITVRIKGQDALYCFRSRILRHHSQPIPCWELQKPRVIQRQQRRKHPRLPLSLRVSVQLLQDALSNRAASSTVSLAGQNGEADAEREAITEYTEDVSLGGCAITTRQPLVMGEEVQLIFHPGDVSGVEGQGRIVRVESVGPPDNAAADLFRLGVRFTTLGAAARRFLRDQLQSDPLFTRLPERKEKRDLS